MIVYTRVPLLVAFENLFSLRSYKDLSILTGNMSGETIIIRMPRNAREIRLSLLPSPDRAGCKAMLG